MLAAGRYGPRWWRIAALWAIIVAVLWLAAVAGCESPTGTEAPSAAEQPAEPANPQQTEPVKAPVTEPVETSGSDSQPEQGERDVSAAAPEQATSAGICDRHDHVQREILWKLDIEDLEDCADVTDADLASITGQLDLADHYTFTALDADDLRGLISLEALRLQLNLPALPAGIFKDLARLRELTLYVDGQSPTLPDGVFDPLERLQVLRSWVAASGPDPFRNNKRLRQLWYPVIEGEGKLNHLRNLRELNVGYVPHLRNAEGPDETEGAVSGRC